MKRVLILASSLVLATASQAFSFAGSDWTLDYILVYHINTNLGSNDIVETMSGAPIVVSQTQVDKFEFPYTLGVIDGTGDFSVSGMSVADTNGGKTTDPFLTDFNGNSVTVRLTYETWVLTGLITGVDSGTSDAFGDRVYEITGDPLTVSDVQIEAFLNGLWVDLGTNNSVEIQDWSMQRPVPEPMSLVVLSGLAAVAARRKKR